MPRTQITSARELGSYIREARKRAGLTLAECAGVNGVGIRFLSELERGKETAELGLALRVAASLGIRLDATLGGESR
jgi:transcriptional regulator with XRE-family HTH domain